LKLKILKGKSKREEEVKISLIKYVFYEEKPREACNFIRIALV